jgi:hypothetical protein
MSAPIIPAMSVLLILWCGPFPYLDEHIIGDRLWAVNGCEPPLRATSYQLPATSQKEAAGCGCWLLAAGCWLLAAGCWLLAAGCWLLATGQNGCDATARLARLARLATGQLMLARCSMLDARCSMLDARCSMLDARCSMLDARSIRTP